jgi:hypothetical protein
MKSQLIAITCILSFSLFGQKSEDLIPKEAISVFSVNNINLLQVVSLDELIQYDFMEEVQQEIFDHSTAGKTIKDIGVDFDQTLNVFSGNNERYEVNGLTFGLIDKDALFVVFDDYEPVKSDYKGVEMFGSYFNRIAIKGNTGVLFNIVPNYRTVSDITDSIWYARGNDYRWEGEYYEEYEEAIEITEEMEIEENTSNPVEIVDFPEAEDNPDEKTYYELLDSVELALQAVYLKQFCDDLFVNQNNLIKNAPEFKTQLANTSEGMFYIDNGRNFVDDYDFNYMRKEYPTFYKDIKELYDGNVILGDLILNDDEIEMKMNILYGEKLGSIYTELTDAKFDENVLKYIHKDNIAYFTYNINISQAYEKTLEVMTPILEKANNKDLTIALLIIELYDEFLNKDAIFNTYNGSMFGTYSGIEKIKTKKIIFNYDEETFEYTEEEVEAEEDMPIFTYGFTTGNNEFSAKVLMRLETILDEFHKENDYWVIDNGVLNAANLYILLKNDLFIVTNDEDLVLKYSDGYGSKSISKDKLASLKNNGAVYANIDLEKVVDDIPKDLLNHRDNELVDLIRGKSGKIELTSSKTTSSSTAINLDYTIEGKHDNSGTYILDLINSFYVLSKQR